jgi:hypothetical protein
MRDWDRLPADTAMLVPPAPTSTVTDPDSVKRLMTPGSTIPAKTGEPPLGLSSTHDGRLALIVTLYVDAVTE